ncbi:MAG: Smr/MutS family protein, partial [Spirochaetales bacterium]|nr:Smr/MutS family protein [Spirochaetales bacterium]
MDSRRMEEFLDRYPPPDDFDKDDGSSHGRQKRISPKKMRIEATIDLHGMTLEEARNALDIFVKQALQNDIRKVLIVHGKGNHPTSEGVIKEMVLHYLERNPSIGATGTPGVRDGGSGATWALIRHRS